MQKINKKHRPPHYLADDEIYFITSSTYQKTVLFNSETKKNMLLDVFREKARKFYVKIIEG
ncbi:hypothetical protein EOM82_03105 [bacterium]|nr:hypothetical protein [bacterium]